MKVSDRLTDTAELVARLFAARRAPRARREVRHAALRHRRRAKPGSPSSATASSAASSSATAPTSTSCSCTTRAGAAGDRRRAAARQRALLQPARAAPHSFPVDSDELGPPLRGRHAPAAERPIAACSSRASKGFATIKRRTLGSGSTRRCCAAERSRARREVCAAFETIRRDVLVAHVDRAKLKSEVAKMRRRMRAELSLAKAGSFDIKQDPGGIADIEFLVDYWVLAQLGASTRSSSSSPTTFASSRRSSESGSCRRSVACDSRRPISRLRQRVHELALDEGGRVVPAHEFADRARVRERRLARGVRRRRGRRCRRPNHRAMPRV